MTTPHQKTIALSRGALDLTYQADEFTLDELLDFAERINPKRAFLFVSKVLGRHIPVAPSLMRSAFTALAGKIPSNLPTPIVVIGMAETAVGLSAGVHSVLKARYPTAILLNSTRHPQDAPLFCEFSEEHSHASRHLIYLSDNPLINQEIMSAKTLIMVDDEASTANTCKNLVNALMQAGMGDLEQTHLATLVDWSLGITNNPFDNNDLTFVRHHLLSGSWQWTNAKNPPPITMPDVATTACGSQPVASVPSFGRVPTWDSTLGADLFFAKFTKKLPNYQSLIGKKVLVLGSNEFVWLPFLLGERLEKTGAMVAFGSLTRSPIALGGAIGAVLKFYDNYGLGMTNFVYNVVFDEWDLVILCIETPEKSVDTLWNNLKVMIVSAI